MDGLTEHTTLDIVRDIISKYSPVLAAGLEATNPLAAFTLTLIARLFDANPNDNEDIASKINLDPEAQSKIKNLESISVQQHKVDVDDRKSAREREVNLATATKKCDIILGIIAITVVVGFFTICIATYFYKPSDDHIIIMLSGGFMMCLSYYFGSSNK